MGGIDPAKHKLDDIYRLHYLFMEILMDELDQSSVTGFISVSECKDGTMGHVALFSNPVQAKKSATVFQVNDQGMDDRWLLITLI